jgi:hypothetical protein
MSNKDFSRLSTSHKAMLVRNKGTYLCKRSLPEVNVSLYLLNSSLVEVFYNPYEGTVEEIKLISSSQSVANYSTFFKAGLA